MLLINNTKHQNYIFTWTEPVEEINDYHIRKRIYNSGREYYNIK